MYTHRLCRTLAAVVMLAALAPAANAQFFAAPGTRITNLSPPPAIMQYPGFWGWLPFTPMSNYAGPLAPINAFTGPVPPMNNLATPTAPTPQEQLENGGTLANGNAGPIGGVAGVPNNTAGAGYYGPANPVGMGVIPRTSDSINARFDTGNRLFVSWAGDPSMVARVTFALLDKNHAVLVRKTITKLPAEARMQLTNKTAYYQVVVEYVNGTTNTFVSPV